MGSIVSRTVAFVIAFVRAYFLPRIRQPDDDAGPENVARETGVRGENVTFHSGDVIQNFLDFRGHETDVGILNEKLRRLLRTRNMALIGDHEFRPVPIDLIREKGDTQEEFGRSGMIQGWILDAAAVFLSVQEIFFTAKREAEKEAQRRTINEIARQRYVATHGNIVGVVGIAGIGKTTLGHQHLELVTQEYENVLDGYVFHISLRDFDYKDNINVLQFLLMSSIPNWKHDLITDKALLENIAASKNVHIIMDALDEAKMDDLSLNAPAMNLYDTATPERIFKNLSSGHILPNAHKMVISRPKAFDKLANKSKPVFVVKALGLGEESQQLLTKRMCSNQAEFNEINRQLSLNPVIKALCFVPVFLKLFTPYALKFQDKVYSLVDIFVSFLEDCFELQLFHPHPSELFKLFELALTGTSNQKYVFDENDLSVHSIQTGLIDSFLNLQIMVNESKVKILDGRKKYFFSHLNWQEFFTALCLMYRYNLVNSEKDVKIRMTDDRWEVVMRFLFGLTNPKVHEKIVGIFPSLAGQRSHYQSQVSALQEIFAIVAREYSSSVQDCPIPNSNLTDYKSRHVWTAFLKQPSDTSLLKLCSFAFESKDPKITKTMVDAIPDKIVLRSTILPSDVIYLCHILRKTSKRVSLIIGFYRRTVTFVGQSLKMFLKKSKGKISKFHISNVNIDEEDIKNLAGHIPQMEELGFTSCNLTSNMIKIITDALMKRTWPIGYFELSENPVDNEAILHISRCMEKIERLQFQENQVTSEGIQQLTNSISTRQEPIKWLGMTKLHLGPVELQYLANCIHQLEALVIFSSHIKGHDLKPLTDAIKTSSRKIQWLDFRNNDLRKEGLDYIADCVENVGTLVLTKCKFGGSDMEKFTQKIATSKNPIDWLLISNNNLQESGIKLLSNCLRNIKSISMSDCKLTDNLVKILCDAISQLTEPMGLLEISFNPLGDESARNFAFCLPNISRLRVYGCNFTATGRQFILSSLEVHNNCCLVEGLDEQSEPTTPPTDETAVKVHG